MHHKYQNNLELNLTSDRSNQTIYTHQYTTYPLRLSPVFRLDRGDRKRAYIYTINTSPGLLAGDELNIALQLDTNTSLYLTDQAATKVHAMPKIGTKAIVNYYLELSSQANLELVAEPIILYRDATLEQRTTIKLNPHAQLFTTEIILPGRLARGEFYEFNYYFSRLEIRDWSDRLLFADGMYLAGKSNAFKGSKLFVPFPIMGKAIAVYPSLDLKLLTTQLESIQTDSMAATSILPGDRGVMIRAFAAKTSQLKQYFELVLNCLRSLTNQSLVPYIPK